MPTQENSKTSSYSEISEAMKKGTSKSIYVAIVLVILLTIVAMTGVYYEYW